MNIGHAVLRNARLYPNHPAIRFEGRDISHGVLAQRMRQLAGGLSARGVEPGTRVAMLAQNCPEYVELFGAAGLFGFTVVGLNYRLAAAEQAAILSDCEPSVLIFDENHIERALELSRGLPKETLFLCIGAKTPAWAQSYDALVSTAQPVPAVAASDDNATLLLCYTSGTTGRSKGVMLSNGGQFEQARVLGMAHQAGQDDRMLIVMPFYHIGGTTELLAYYLVGATIILHRAFDATEVLASMQTHRVTSAHLAPTMIQMMLDVQRKTPYDVSTVKTICYASAPMSIALSREARGVFGPIFMQVYGMTEQGLGTVLYKHQHLPDGKPHEARRMASAGQPMMGAEIRTVREDGSTCDDEEVGEVHIRSSVTMQGYWRNPEATASALSNGWLRTGDVGYFDNEGFLFICDRKKDMIISGGENIYSREVEEALLLHPAVAEAAVIGVPDEKWGESVKAFVVLRPGATANADELIAHCRTMIAGYKRPRAVEFLSVMPRISSTNKIDKKTLRAPYWEGRERNV